MDRTYESDLQRRIYLEGAYDMCRLLLTFPTFHPFQQQVIGEQAIKTKTQLEALGVEFTQSGRVM